MGIFDFLSGGGKNPADAASPYLDKIPNIEKSYYNPFITQGNVSYNKFDPVYSKMTSDPAAFLESIMKNYVPSKGYQLKNDAMLKAAGNTAAAGGTRGSINDINQEAKITDMLMSDDMQQWLQNVLGIQGTGLQGEQHLYDTGFNASRDLAGDLSNVLGTQAQLEFQGQRENNQRSNDMMSGIGKLAGAGIGGYFGGPWGAAAGANIGGSFF